MMKGHVEQRPIKIIPGQWVMLVPPDPEFEGALTLHVLIHDNYQDEPNKIGYLAYGSIADDLQTLYLLHGGEIDKGEADDAIGLVLIDISGSEDFRDNAKHLIELSKKPKPTKECL
jgi:hypothetical protein